MYLGSVFILLAIIGYLFYQNSSNSMKSAMRFEMLYSARMIESKLLMQEEQNNTNIDLSKFHPMRFKIGFFDKNKKPIFAEIKSVPTFNKEFYAKNLHCYSVIKYPGSKLNIKYIVLREDELKKKLHKLKIEVIYYLIILFIFMSIVGFFLSRLFLKPIKEKIETLDRFIEDTTHELNTPISAILMTIQTLKGIESKKLERLKVSALRLSSMYDSLSFLLTRDNIYTKSQVDLKDFIKDRVFFIKPIAENKKIKIVTNLESTKIEICQEGLKRVIDNLLSNAIKYSNVGGRIEIELKNYILKIKDYGIGMSKEEQKNIFKRYARFNKDRGGFGIGLNIVFEVAKKNNIKIDLKSKKGKGTTFILYFTR